MKNILPPTTKKVAINTHPNSNTNIRNNTLRRINVYKNSSDKILSDNIEKLNNEWDVERVLGAHAACMILGSTIMGLKTNKKYWFLLTGTVGLFLAQHALQGWCPTVPLARKMGIRTAEEINNEKIVYKLLREDFNNTPANVDELLNIAEK